MNMTNLGELFQNADLVIFKGDANYRRVFGDRQLPITLQTAGLTDYLPAPSFAIRMLKSELLVGLSDQKAGDVARLEEDWMTNGRYGLIQKLS